jgi:hypothetical protein
MSRPDDESDPIWREIRRQALALEAYNLRGKHNGRDYVIPKRRVKVDAEGRLTFMSPKAMGPTETSKEWWEHVLRDYRVRPVDPRRTYQRLSYIRRGEAFVVVCDHEAVLKQFGSDYMIRYVAYELVSRPLRRAFGKCGAQLDHGW